MKTTIQLEINNCTDCPKNYSVLTKGYGHAVDYKCSEMDGKTSSGYVEWNSDINPVPEWCPLKV